MNGGILAPPADLLIDDCETAWTGTTGLLRTVNATPTAGGSGYTAGDILDVTTGGTGGKVQVSTVDGGGAVTAIAHYAGGYGGYTTGTGKATSGGSGSGCTVNITGVTTGGVSRSTSQVHDGTYALRAALITTLPRALLGYRAISPGNLGAYSQLRFWVYCDDTTPDITDGALSLCLCSDALGRVIVDEIVLPALPVATWTEYTLGREGGGPLGSDIQSIALRRTSTALAGISVLFLDDIWAIP